MPEWKHTLNVKDLWDAFKADELTSGQVANSLAKRINKQLIPKFEDDHELIEIAEQFELMGEDPEFDDTDEFDYHLDELYNWADYERVWIKTI